MQIAFRHVGCAILGGVLASCALAAPYPVPTLPTAAANISPQPEPISRCTDLPVEQPELVTRANDNQLDESEQKLPPSLEEPGETNTMPISYDLKTNTIFLNGNAATTLPALSGALSRPDLLHEQMPGEWILNANLWIGKGAVLDIAGPTVRRLKLRSDSRRFVWIKAFGARLTFADTCVTSWDVGRNSVDTADADGRSFVLAREGARLDILRSELSYLGYFANESYGVAWRQAGTSGAAIDSRFGYNFYGLYSYEASDLVIRGNEVHHSIRYGIDPHTRSNRLSIENNTAHHNGKHGIILAEACSESTIRGNTVYGNGLHGIVIYQRSNGNVIENNISYDNGLQGINVNESSNNVVRRNTVYGNAEAGIGIGQRAASNALIENQVRDNHKDGISFYSDASANVVRENIVSGNVRYGIYVKSPHNTIGARNQIFGNAVGIYLNVTPLPEVSLDTNQVYDNHDANLRIAGG
ncbi:MAG TPA: right-handed parallel beta-helix repeat-containing protein [Roseiflexaceae bacterium]|nr:right-handed parallel beta-helix repeat-containing protein [Roseiflexaceae bacterium]